MPVAPDRKQFSISDDKDIVDLIDQIAQLAGCTRADIYKFAVRQFLARVDQADTPENALLTPLREFVERQRTKRKA